MHVHLAFSQAHEVQFFQKASEALHSFLSGKFWTKRKVFFASPVQLTMLMIAIENLKLGCACVCVFTCLHTSWWREQACLKT